jgi:Ca2+-binding RTX toxin-like protein
MAKIVISDVLGEQGSLADYFDPSKMVAQKYQSAKAIYTDETSNAHIVLTGTGFEYDPMTHVMTAGTVTKINIENSDLASLVTITQGTFDGAKIIQAVETKGIEKGLQIAFAKADTFVGSANGDVLYGFGGADNIKGNDGNDILGGGKGNDVLYGGTGSDLFVFNKGDGHDTIRDFDADGGGLNQDYIAANYADVLKIRPIDHHTVEIDFKNGDELTLQHATASHIDQHDFHTVM